MGATAGRPRWARLRRELSRADLPDDLQAFDHAYDLHCPLGAGIGQRIDLVDLPDQPGSGAPRFEEDRDSLLLLAVELKRAGRENPRPARSVPMAADRPAL